ncbi:LysR substrate-binding domain-containing protein [Arenibacterium sp. LLYu02]|uniref:LysR substrate-binding domain-containing protein n=1 Tax=Arenibacterium sp. LLYu02 TaxID=3404132 RepID=UPI003B2189C2
MRRVVCGAPSYFARFGRLAHPGDLAEGHRMIVTGPPLRDWRFGADQRTVVRPDPQLCVNTVGASIEVARQGWGVCRVLSYQVAEDLKQGCLATVLEEHEPAPVPIHIVHPGRRKTPAKLRTFIDFAAERLRRLPALRPH